MKKITTAVCAVLVSMQAHSGVLYLECNGTLPSKYGGGEWWERIMLDTDKESGTHTWRSPVDGQELTEPYFEVVITPEFYAAYGKSTTRPSGKYKLLQLDRRDGSANFNGAEGTCAKVDPPKTLF